ncbi:DUF4362 domain-containing protein [Bacillus solitudinis]|uniref:DUF4362 domain-containing protein n=1 Tax=Bacillus solitudinis TaxID=2014074 RepID=UPI000C2511EA|nr:DUF4362 domain-containing protein [Bacillus solitudinis]
MLTKLLGLCIFVMLSAVLTACSSERTRAIDNGDVVHVNGSVYNFSIFETFIDNLHNKQESYIRILTYTDEGEPLHYNLEYKESNLMLEIDYSKDKLRGSVPDKLLCKDLLIKKELQSKTYSLLNCDSPSSDSFELFRVYEMID